VANASRHLQLLRRAQLVVAQRDGLFVRYRLSGPEVTGLVLVQRQTAEQHLAEVDRVVRDFLGDRDSLEPVTPDELAQRMAHGDVVLLDVRPEQEFSAGHIAGAVSTPAAEIAARLAELPHDQGLRGVLPGPVLRIRRRGPIRAARAWTSSTTADQRLPRVAAGGTAGERNAVATSQN
jgi:hypothetical protein